MDCVVHVAFIMHVALYNMQWLIALHMHADITLNACECMVYELTLRLVLIGCARSNGTTSNRVAWLNKVVKKTCVGY